MKDLNEILKNYFEKTVRKDMMSMGFEEPHITYMGYVGDYDASYREGDPVLSGWVVANNFNNKVYLDLEGGGELYYSGDSSIHYCL